MSKSIPSGSAQARIDGDQTPGTGVAAGDSDSALPQAATGSEAELSHEHRTVTALSVRVTGPAALVEQMGVEEWSVLVSGVVDLGRSTILLHGGRVVESLNDGLLALFGVPGVHPHDPVQAVHAALHLLDGIRQRAQVIEQEHGTGPAVHINLCTGPVVVRPTSSGQRFECPAPGGVMDLAHMQFLDRPLEVLISEDTHRLVAAAFDCEDLGLAAFGSGQKRLFRVRGPRPGLGETSGRASLQTPLVGRDVELKALLQLGQAVRAGLGRAVLVIGEPGLGKTRLIRDWQATEESLTDQPPVQWARAGCSSDCREEAYYLLQYLVHSLLGVSFAANEGETHTALLSVIQELFGSIEGEEGLTVYAFLGHLLSVELEGAAQDRVRHADPQALRAQYLAALRQLLRMLAGRHPIVLILENLHWADPSSVDLLSQLLSLSSSAPLLFCLITRPDREAPGWRLVTAAREAIGGSLVELTLDALAEPASQQLLSNLLGPHLLPEHIQTMILAKAEGNPLFLEELTHMLIEGGAIGQQDGQWVLREELKAVDIPDTLEGLLLARIDCLPDDVKHTLRVAAVVGRHFPLRVLERALDHEQGRMQIIGHLNALESAGLVNVSDVVPELTYRFRNVLIRDMAYRSMLPADRQRLHLAVAHALEDTYPLKVHELAPTLAQHYSQALGVSQLSVEQQVQKYLTMAGAAALAAYANQEAEGHYRRALELARGATHSDAERAALLVDLGEALFRQSRFSDALQAWNEAIGLCRVLGDSDRVARLHAHSARALWFMGNRTEALQRCEQGLQAVDGAPESPGIAILMHETARAYRFSEVGGDEARRLCQRALEMAERLGVVEVQADVLATLGILLDQPPHEAIAALTRAVELAESAGLLAQAQRAHNNLGAVLQDPVGDFHAAHDHYRRAAEINRQMGYIEGELVVLSNLASLSLATGNFAEVEAMFPVIERLLEGSANPGPAELGMRINRGLLLRYRGELSQAAHELRACQAEARQRDELEHWLLSGNSLAGIVLELAVTGEEVGTVDAAGGAMAEIDAMLLDAIDAADRRVPDGRAWPRCQLSMVRAAQRRFGDARRLLTEADHLIDAQPKPLDQGWLWWARAWVATREGRWAEALAAWENATALFDRLRMDWWWARALQEWAEAHSWRGEPTDLERARALLREAQVTFEELNVAHYAAQTRDRLQALTAQIYASALAHQQVIQQLAVASQVQKSLLPAKTPSWPGWQLAVYFDPAGETYGDFYDFVRLSKGRCGILVADVVDKGIGAALYMTMVRTLIRTFASRYPTRPDMVVRVVNRRMLADAPSSAFVTLFYGVLDPLTGTLDYCNAGHNPPYLVRSRGAGGVPEVQPLHRTGMAMGVVRGGTWECSEVQLAPGDLLVLYTDGVTEAQNEQGGLFGQERLLGAIRDSMAAPVDGTLLAHHVQDVVLAAVHDFVGGAPRFDDVTLLVAAHTP